MKVVIASTNPVKINAAERAFEKMFPEENFSFEGVSVKSNVSDQPMSDQETFDGATNRAENASKEYPDADFWVGIEGGLEERRGELELFAWIVIKEKSGTLGKGRTSTLFLPRIIAAEIMNGAEVGTATDKVFNKHNTKQDQGLVGILTNDLISRTEYYVDPVIMALIPFKNEELYQK